MLDFECWMHHIVWESSIISLSMDQGICVSYLAQVGFEFLIWAWVQATAGTAIGSGDHHQFSFLQWLTQYFIVCLCIQMSGGKKATAEMVICKLPPPAITVFAVTLISSSGGELKLYLSCTGSTAILGAVPKLLHKLSAMLF